ncbi:MAG: hypothetical protein DHS20C14_11490 [Phycisphaeraceae bacterium]|nr:MAG: hypothetical protein DHS20C14_11490 [Phycisphaeraceae bacterium]
MVPNASDLAHRRLTLVAVVRVLAVVVWIIATSPIIVFFSIASIEPSSVEGEVIAVIALLSGGAAVVGVIIWFLASPLSRWMLPRPEAHACPRCGYDLRSIVEPRCPECGTVLTQEFMPNHVAVGTTRSPEGRVLTAQLVVVVIARLGGLALALWMGLWFLSTASQLILFADADWHSWNYTIPQLIMSAFGFLACAVPIFFPRRLARWAVPIKLLDPLTEPPAPPTPPVPPAPAAEAP